MTTSSNSASPLLNNRTHERFDAVLKRLLGNESHSLLFLIQTDPSLRTRYHATARVDRPELYQEAHLETPAQVSTRKWQAHSHLWMEYMMRQVDTTRSTVWLGTTARSRRTSKPSERVRVIDLVASDPFGWSNNQKLDSEKPSLVNLDAALHSLEDGCLLFVDSVAPLLLLHGFDALVEFLESLQRRMIQVVMPVPIQSLTHPQHCVLEDQASAVLCLHSGDDQNDHEEATFLRRGIRESSNLIRTPLRYRIKTTTSSEKNNMASALQVQVLEPPVATTTTTTSPATSSSVAATTTPKTSSSSSVKPGKVKLEFESDTSGPKQPQSTSEPSSSGPRIFLQEDDPEMEDFDEEDPDDDLEI